MKHFITILFSFSFIIAQLNIVTTTTDLAAIAKEVGGIKVKVSSIHTGKQDPHYLTAKPSYIIRVRNADLFIRIGMELEVGWEPLLLKGARNNAIQPGKASFMDVASIIKPLEIPTGPINRSMGDVHPFGNPHYWLDPYNGRIIAKSMAERFGQLDPKNSNFYNANAKHFIRKIDVAMFGENLVNQVAAEKLWVLQQQKNLEAILKKVKTPLGGWALKMAKFKNKKIITYHRSWSYFLNRFHLKTLIELEPKPGISPSSSHLLKVIRLGIAEKPCAILMEPYYNPKVATLVSKKIGVKVLIAPNSVNGNEQVSDYIELFNYLVVQFTS